MAINLKIVLIIITIIYITVILKNIKNKKMQISLSGFWIISGIALICLLLIPNFVEILTKILGFEVPSNMIFCITIFVGFYMIFNITIKVSSLYQENINMVQEISILKNKIKNLEKELNTKKEEK